MTEQSQELEQERAFLASASKTSPRNFCDTDADPMYRLRGDVSAFGNGSYHAVEELVPQGTVECRHDHGSQGTPLKWNRRSEDKTIWLALIDDRALAREALSHLLTARCDDFAVSSFSSAEELLRDASGRGNSPRGVVLFSMGATTRLGDALVQQSVQQIRQALPDMPLLIMSEAEDALSVGFALKCGIRGYIPPTVTLSVMKEAIRLVQVGGSFFPVELLAKALDALSPETRSRDAGDLPIVPARNLSPRELQVTQAVAQGKPNKLIAHELCVQECTVKVHVTRIMKKLCVTNRTQIAIVANQMTRVENT